VTTKNGTHYVNIQDNPVVDAQGNTTPVPPAVQIPIEELY
jgi:hypothetical protein